MRIGVVTDNSSDLPQSVFARADVISVPLDVRLGNRDPEYLRTLTGDEFWEVVRSSNDLPTTAAPSPGAFEAAFRELGARGCAAIICITISSGLSSTFQSASVASSSSDIPVVLIDSQNATMGQGLLVLEALETREHFEDIAAFREHLERTRTRITTIGTLDTLEYLRRGGRIGSAQAFFGTLLSIKPIVEVRNGLVEGIARQRTRGRSLAELSTRVHAAGPLERIAVVHALAHDVALLTDLLHDVETREPLVLSTIGPVIGAHTGIGTIGVAFQRQLPEES